MLVYGRNVALEILKKNDPIKKIYLQEGFNDKNIISLIEKNEFKPIYKTKEQINDLIDGNHQGIILDIPDYQYKSIQDISKKEDAFIVILDHLEDPHNLGAIIRTCEAAGVDNIIIPNSRQVGITGTIMKTSAGALTNVDIIEVSNIANTIKKLKDEGFWIVGTTLSDDSVDYREINYDGKIALVIGNEAKGMSRLVESLCDFKAKIPMFGKINSLNASVASGIMIYEIIRNRK